MRFNDIVDQVNSYAPNADVELLMRAYMFSAKAHDGQTRRSGEPYLTHPIAVAGILAELHMDVDTIATGLLHDTMEDCLATRSEMASEFGDEVADMVDGVTKIGKLQFRNKQEAQAENFRKLVLAMATDVRVILVKLADRLHNMRTMEHMRADKQRAISRETLDIFAPIANRLGLSKIKTELEDLCFRYLHPDVFGALNGKLGAGAPERVAYTVRTSRLLQQELDERGLRCSVHGRPKHLFSIYRKMLDQNLAFEQVHDLNGFRIFVDDLGQCYTALGLIHSKYRHVPSRLKDYIANPKSNGYQSLHTVVRGPEGEQIEIQIRTHEMHRVAEFGIAAHWRYKEGHLTLTRDDLNKIARLRSLFEAANEVDDPTEFLETVKVDLFSNEIFAFTPAGDVRFFPQGATVLDFAYAIHSQVGHTCHGARVDGRMVPLRHRLANGDEVEILTRPGQHPSRDWLEWALTGRALSKIRRHLREEERRQSRDLGHKMLFEALKKRGYNLLRLQKQGKLEQAARAHGVRKAEQLFLALGQGNVTLPKLLPDLVSAEDVADPDETPKGAIQTIIQKVRSRSESPVTISGEQDVMVGFARCCGPLPGEAVIGYVTRGRGITVHVANCREVLHLEPERRIKVEWQRTAKGRHTGEVQIICSNKPGMLADVGAVCKSAAINITSVQSRALEDDKAELTLSVSIADVRELGKLIRHLERIEGVISVDRMRAAPG